MFFRESKREVEAERAQYTDMPNIEKMARKAYEQDPLGKYLRDTPDPKLASTTCTAPRRRPLSWLYRRLAVYFELGYYIRYHAAFTVSHGDAYITIDRPGPGKTQRALKRMVDAFGMKVIDRDNTPQQRKRWKGFWDKLGAALEDAFGDEIDGMLHVVNLATAPEHQGKGYGTALMALANAEADSIGCTSWLLSSNVVNTPFYESCGFVTVKKILLGERDATWTQPPFYILVMMRERPSSSSSYDEKGLV